MSDRSGEAAHEGFATEQVPDGARGSGWRIFFIVAGSLCGLPTFMLSASIFGSLGLERGVQAVLIGTSISAVLGALTASAGSRTRTGLALLSDHAFGRRDASLVKLVIALSLVGWFGVNVGVLGAATAGAISRMSGVMVPPLAIGLPVCVAIAAVTIVGARGLERLGAVLVPVALLVLVGSVVLVSDRTDGLREIVGSGALGFGQAVSAVVGSYVVGIVIQPDYGRFVRRPIAAAAGAGAALGIAYPIILSLASVASLVLGAPELITAMVILGFGVPALTVLVLGAWIDASACLYSGSLSLVNQFPRLRMTSVVIGITLVGILLVLLGADAAFIPFLVALGVSLPPLAAVLVISAHSTRGVSDDGDVEQSPSWIALLSWILGSAVGVCTSYGVITITTLPTLDSALVAAVAFLALRRFGPFRPPAPARVVGR